MEPDLTEFEQAGRRYRLLVDDILEKLDEERRAKLEAALRRDDISTYKVAAVVTKWGHPVGSGAVHKWRTRNLT